MTRPKLTIANTNGGHLTAQFVMSLVNTIEADRSVEYIHGSGPYLVDNRNRLVAQFLEDGGEWLLMIDSDMSWEPSDVARLVHSAGMVDRPVVSGLYFSQLGPMGLTALPVAWGMDREAVDWTRGGVVQAVSFGAGFLLAHRSVLRQLVAVHGRAFEVLHEEGGSMIGEDMVFCRRARDLGHKLWVNCDVVVGHVKAATLIPNDGRFVDESASLSEAAS